MSNTNNFQIVVARYPPLSNNRGFVRINCTVDSNGNLNLNFEDRTNPDAFSNALDVQPTGRALAIAGGTTGAGTTGAIPVWTDGPASVLGDSGLSFDPQTGELTTPGVNLITIGGSVTLVDSQAPINAPEYQVSGVAGVDGSFTSQDGKTVTVTKGIVTSIV